MKPKVRVFTRSAPCTVKHIWNCFREKDTWKIVQVDKAHAEIGLNAPRYLEKMERIERVHNSVGDFYKVTSLGKEWLEKKVRAYMRNHPSDAKNVKNPPSIKVVNPDRLSEEKAVKRVVRARRS